MPNYSMYSVHLDFFTIHCENALAAPDSGKERFRRGRPQTEVPRQPGLQLTEAKQTGATLILDSSQHLDTAYRQKAVHSL